MKGIVNRTVLSVYEVPDKETERIDELLYGMEVSILSFEQSKKSVNDQEENEEQWVLIETPYRYRGYVIKEALVTEETPELSEEWNRGVKRRILKAHADVLSIPKVQGILIQEITRGAVVLLEEEDTESGWSKVCLADGRKGYIKNSFLEPLRKTEGIKEEFLRASIVATARTYLGTQYRWGGKSPLGIDCSGLTSIAYLINGVYIYRDAKIKEGFPVHEILFEDRKAGDLLYFKGHIAMVLDNRRYIHSTGKNGSDGVVINSLYPEDPDYREDLAKGILSTGSIF